MNDDQLRTLFTNPFNYSYFLPFCVEVLGIPRYALAMRVESGTPIIYDKDEVIDARVVANVENGGWRVGVIVYKLSTRTTLTRPIGLRKLVAPLIRYDFDAVIAVFQSTEDWRLSFIENLPNTNEGRRSARRYTYVFGHHDELYRTPISTFSDLQKLPDDKKGFKAYRVAFSVEALGDQFFKEYKRIYEDFVQEITGRRYVPVKGKSNTFVEEKLSEASPFFETAFNGDGKAVRDYVKKMMGRLVFLQFLQKKGWMGVPKGVQWDAHKGERRYLQKLFEAYCHQTSDFNFLEDILEPLFFNALNTDRRQQGDVVDAALWLEAETPIRIPFLSGSLFERDALDERACRFSQKHFEELFKLFDQFNFTIDESDPTDAEIGIAPDMLGRIFENLLEDNKDKGAFYTPHEIVQYMCQEALLAYLDVETKLDHKLLERLVREHTIEEESKVIRAVLKDALTRVKICDPAIGSGAFPMGMLHELLACHKALAQEASKSANERREAFTQIKRDIIANNIYGVDIEQGAVDIARLRFWLSLVIDEKEPKPLPNLDYKIVRGDSLCAMYDGEPINLNRGPGTKAAIAKSLVRFQNLAMEFEDATGEDRVARRRDANLALLDALEAYYTVSLSAEARVEQSLFGFADNTENCQLCSTRAVDSSSEHMLAKIRELRKRIQSGSTESVPFFDWQVNCSDVLGEPRPPVVGLPSYERGFDIVIGNPPYIHFEDIRLKGSLYGANSLTYDARGDIYCLFYEKGLSLLRPHGILCYITSNSWMRVGYGEKLRSFFANYSQIRLLLDFAGGKIFNSATVSTNILLAERFDMMRTKTVLYSSASKACLAQDDKVTLLADLPGYVHSKAYDLTFPSDGSSWAILSPIEQSIKEKIEKYGTPLKEWDVTIKFGIKTGADRAFIIDAETKDRLIAQDPRSAEIIRPILRGRDIKRYGYTFADKWLIATHNGYEDVPRIDVNDYPAVKNWLDAFKNKLSKRSDKGATLYNLRDCAYWSLFAQPHLVWKRIGSKVRFGLCTDEMYSLDSTCVLVGKHLSFLCAILNSKIGHYLLKTAPTTGTGDLLLSVQALCPVRLAQPTEKILQSVNYFFSGLLSEDELLNEFATLYHFSHEELNVICQESMRIVGTE